jgi:3-isopropylmalate dehydrogenase
MGAEADKVEQAIAKVLDKGLRTADIMQEGMRQVSTAQMGEAIIGELES